MAGCSHRIAPSSEHTYGPDDECAKIDDAGRKCCPGDMGRVSLYVNLYNENRGSMKIQIRKMYESATGKLLKDAMVKLLYWKKVKEWAEKNKDKITDAYGDTLLPGHVFFGYKAAESTEKKWHFSSNHDYEGKVQGKVYMNNYSKVTHFRHYKACPETLKLIAEYVALSQANKPYYHWNAGELKVSDGKKMSNCVVFALDAVAAGGISIKDLGTPLEPWDLAHHSSFTKSDGGAE